MKISIDQEKCIGCELCVRVCPQKVLAMTDGKLQVVHPDHCMGCFGCEEVCPHGAVRVLRARPTAEVAIEPSPEVTTCDVAVVGAGPAGLGTAITCARAGLDVVVFDRLPNRTLSHHPDSGVLYSLPWLSSVQVEEDAITFPELEIAVRVGEVHRCEVLGLLGPDGLSTGSRLPPNVDGWVVAKDRLVRELVDEAERAGARIWYNALVHDVLKEEGRVVGVRLSTGEEVRARVVVTADGVSARISEKAGLPISHDDLWYVSLLAFEYDDVAADLPSGLYYLNGGMPFAVEGVGTFGGLSTTDTVHVMVAFISRKRTYPAPEPLEWYVRKLIAEDGRVQSLVGDALRGREPAMLTGCRAVFRGACCPDVVGEGVIAVGDAWVDDGELGNVPALANGVHAGRVIIEAARRNDFSKAALNLANEFRDPRLLKALAENKRMKLLSAMLSEEEMRRMFLFMQHMDYPLLFFGNRRQQSAMMVRFLLKNLFRFLRYPRIARLFF